MDEVIEAKCTCGKELSYVVPETEMAQALARADFDTAIMRHTEECRYGIIDVRKKKSDSTSNVEFFIALNEYLETLKSRFDTDGKVERATLQIEAWIRGYAAGAKK